MIGFVCSADQFEVIYRAIEDGLMSGYIVKITAAESTGQVLAVVEDEYGNPWCHARVDASANLMTAAMGAVAAKERDEGRQPAPPEWLRRVNVEGEIAAVEAKLARMAAPAESAYRESLSYDEAGLVCAMLESGRQRVRVAVDAIRAIGAAAEAGGVGGVKPIADEAAAILALPIGSDPSGFEG